MHDFVDFPNRLRAGDGAGHAPRRWPRTPKSVLTVAMTAGDIPATTGNPDQGFEGFRFVGYNLYDGLALWDLSQQRQAVRHQAGPRHLVGGRSQQPQALDLSICARA